MSCTTPLPPKIRPRRSKRVNSVPPASPSTVSFAMERLRFDPTMIGRTGSSIVLHSWSKNRAGHSTRMQRTLSLHRTFCAVIYKGENMRELEHVVWENCFYSSKISGQAYRCVYRRDCNFPVKNGRTLLLDVLFGRFLLGPEIRSKMMFSERGVGGKVRLDFRLNIKIHAWTDCCGSF